MLIRVIYPLELHHFRKQKHVQLDKYQHILTPVKKQYQKEYLER